MWTTLFAFSITCHSERSEEFAVCPLIIPATTFVGASRFALSRRNL